MEQELDEAMRRGNATEIRLLRTITESLKDKVLLKERENFPEKDRKEINRRIKDLMNALYSKAI